MSDQGPQYQDPQQPYQQPYQPAEQGAPQQGDPATTGSGGDPAKKSGPNVSGGQILAGILVVLIIIFVVENSRSVKIRLIIPQVQAPLYVAILISAVVGALISWLLRVRRAKSAERRRMAKQYKQQHEQR